MDEHKDFSSSVCCFRHRCSCSLCNLYVIFHSLYCPTHTNVIKLKLIVSDASENRKQFSSHITESWIMNKTIMIIHRTTSTDITLFQKVTRIFQFFLDASSCWSYCNPRDAVHVKMLGDIKIITARFVLILQLLNPEIHPEHSLTTTLCQSVSQFVIGKGDPE